MNLGDIKNLKVPANLSGKEKESKPEVPKTKNNKLAREGGLFSSYFNFLRDYFSDFGFDSDGFQGFGQNQTSVKDLGEKFEVIINLLDIDPAKLHLSIEDYMLLVSSVSREEVDGRQKLDLLSVQVGLPSPVNGDAAEASYKDGKLTVTVPKVQKKKIEIKTG